MLKKKRITILFAGPESSIQVSPQILSLRCLSLKEFMKKWEPQIPVDTIHHNPMLAPTLVIAHASTLMF